MNVLWVEKELALLIYSNRLEIKLLVGLDCFCRVIFRINSRVEANRDRYAIPETDWSNVKRIRLLHIFPLNTHLIHQALHFGWDSIRLIFRQVIVVR